MLDHLYSTIKWSIVIIVAAAAFYIVYPKYHFELGGEHQYRANKITGKVVKYGWAIESWFELK